MFSRSASANSISIVMNAGYEHMMQAIYISKKDTRRFSRCDWQIYGWWICMG
jgi:hypothetical protein